jgi:hypothetical protein
LLVCPPRVQARYLQGIRSPRDQLLRGQRLGRVGQSADKVGHPITLACGRKGRCGGPMSAKASVIPGKLLAVPQMRQRSHQRGSLGGQRDTQWLDIRGARVHLDEAPAQLRCLCSSWAMIKSPHALR